MTIPIDEESHPEEHKRTPEETEQGNPGKPQRDYEVAGPHHPGETLEQADPTDPRA
jgi:hypothetical protein